MLELARDGSVVQQLGTSARSRQARQPPFEPARGVGSRRRDAAGRRHAQRPRPGGRGRRDGRGLCRSRRTGSPRRRSPSSCRTGTCSSAMRATAGSSSTTPTARSWSQYGEPPAQPQMVLVPAVGRDARRRRAPGLRYGSRSSRRRRERRAHRVAAGADATLLAAVRAGASLRLAPRRRRPERARARAGSVRRGARGLTAQLDGALSLDDPHDVRLLPNGHLLITDAPLGLVVETDWNGQIFRTIGGDGGPEHSTIPTAPSCSRTTSILVCDSGNHRRLVGRSDGAVGHRAARVQLGLRLFRFSGPRYAEVSPTGVLVVADTGNNRVLAAAESGELLWELASVPGTRLPFLNQPRWAQLTARGRGRRVRPLSSSRPATSVGAAGNLHQPTR